eukprot:31198-Pelagococcus_subviridis.AAC.53
MTTAELSNGMRLLFPSLPWKMMCTFASVPALRISAVCTHMQYGLEGSRLRSELLGTFVLTITPAPR